jgi:hypothetical protein
VVVVVLDVQVLVEVAVDTVLLVVCALGLSPLPLGLLGLPALPLGLLAPPCASAAASSSASLRRRSASSVTRPLSVGFKPHIVSEEGSHARIGGEAHEAVLDASGHAVLVEATNPNSIFCLLFLTPDATNAMLLLFRIHIQC